MQTLIDLTASIVTAHLANNRIAAGDVPNFLTEVHTTLTMLTASEANLNANARRAFAVQPQLASSATGDKASDNADADIEAGLNDAAVEAHVGPPAAPIAAAAAPEPLVPAVPIEDSIQPDRIVCLEDGANVILLKRHLRTNFQMTPDQYRRRWKLPMDYPMVAPNYAEQKRAIALKGGFGKTIRPPSKGGVAKVEARPVTAANKTAATPKTPVEQTSAAATAPAPVKRGKLKPAFSRKQATKQPELV